MSEISLQANSFVQCSDDLFTKGVFFTCNGFGAVYIHIIETDGKRERDMIYQIKITRNGRTKLLGNPLAGAPHSFDSREFAQHFADSCLRNFVLHWKNQGLRAPKYEVVVAAA